MWSCPIAKQMVFHANLLPSPYLRPCPEQIPRSHPESSWRFFGTHATESVGVIILLSFHFAIPTFRYDPFAPVVKAGSPGA